MTSNQSDIEIIESAWARHSVAFYDGLIAECACGLREDNHEERIALDALAAAGRLIPPGGEVRRQWSARKASGLDGIGIGLSTSSREHAMGDLQRWLSYEHGYPVEGELVSREVRSFEDGSMFVGPWVTYGQPLSSGEKAG